MSDAPTLYNLDRFGAFTGEITKARLSPADAEKGDEVWLIPDRAATEPPPAVSSGEVAVWRDGQWAVVPDYRGMKAYDTSTMAERVIEEPGDVKASETLTPPPSPRHTWVNGNWRLPLAVAKAARLQEIKDKLDEQNAAGFLYNGRMYQIDEASQARITAIALMAATSAGDWPANFAFVAADNTLVPFTAAEFTPFAVAALKKVVARRINARALKNAVITASDAAALAAVDITAGW